MHALVGMLPYALCRRSALSSDEWLSGRLTSIFDLIVENINISPVVRPYEVLYSEPVNTSQYFVLL